MSRVEEITALTTERSLASVGKEPGDIEPSVRLDNCERIARALFVHDVAPEDMDDLLRKLVVVTENCYVILAACPSKAMRRNTLHGMFAQAIAMGIAYGVSVAAGEPVE